MEIDVGKKWATASSGRLYKYHIKVYEMNIVMFSLDISKYVFVAFKWQSQCSCSTRMGSWEYCEDKRHLHYYINAA